MSTKCSEHWARDTGTGQSIHIYFDYADQGYHLEYFDGKRRHHFKISEKLCDNLRTEKEMYLGQCLLKFKGKKRKDFIKKYLDWLEQQAVEDEI